MTRSILPLFAVAFAASAPALASELVPVAHFDSVELRGGGNVVVVPGPAERVTIVEGSPRFTRFTVDRHGSLKIDTCNGQCPHLYRLRVQIQSPHVPALAVSGGGAISISPGFAPQREITAAVQGGGRIDTRAVEGIDVSAAIQGGGELLVRARSNLSGAVSGGGDVRYWGNPQVSSAINGGGSVRPGS
jgi:putative autotransporter adhesin-like protein